MKRMILLAKVLLLAVPLAVTAQAPPFSTLDGTPYDPATEPHPDLFISHWHESMPRHINGALIVRDILTPLESGDPLRPHRRGAVLTEIERFSYAILEPHAVTTPTKLAGEQHIYYVASGIGTITTGGATHALREGIGILMPPGVEFAMTNTGECDLGMYLVVEPIPEEFTPRSDALIRDEKVIPLGGTTGHWTHISMRLFEKADGLAVLDGMSPVWFDPMTMGQPHSHDEGIEEVWFSLKGTSRILLGKQMRDFPVGTAYKIPPNGLTWHSTINVTDEPVKVFWFMKSGPHAMHPTANLDPEPYDPATEPDIDMFMASFTESNPFHTHGSLLERHILTKGDGETIRPTTRGQVLKYVNRYTRASLMAGNVTEPVTLAGEQEIFFVISGEGVIESAGTTATLHHGVTVLAPAGCEFTITNTGTEALNMYLICEPIPPGFRPNDDLLVVDESNQPVSTSNTHWVGIAKTLLTTADGLGTLESVITCSFAPNTFFHPHSHVEGTEEVWTAIDKPLHVLIGKEIRHQEPGEAYLIPTTGQTPHANFNVGDEPVKLFYYARYGDHEVRP